MDCTLESPVHCRHLHSNVAESSGQRAPHSQTSSHSVTNTHNHDSQRGGVCRETGAPQGSTTAQLDLLRPHAYKSATLAIKLKCDDSSVRHHNHTQSTQNAATFLYDGKRTTLDKNDKTVILLGKKRHRRTEPITDS